MNRGIFGSQEIGSEQILLRSLLWVLQIIGKNKILFPFLFPPMPHMLAWSAMRS